MTAPLGRREWRAAGGGLGLALLLALLLPFGGAQAADSPAAPDADSPLPRLDVTLAGADPTVGSVVEATITLTTEAGSAPVAFPDWTDRWGEAEILSASPVERLPPESPEPEGGARFRQHFRQRVRLTAFRPGEIALPPVAVTVAQGAGPGAASGTEQATRTLRSSEGLSFKVRAVLGEGDEPAASRSPVPWPASPPRRLPLPATFWPTLGALAAAILALALVLRRRTLRARATAAPEPLAELHATLLRLRRDASSPGEEGEPAEGLSRLSLALRRYLDRRLAVPALESTPTEVAVALRRSPLLPEIGRDLVALLRRCDAVRFRARPPRPSPATGAQTTAATPSHVQGALSLAEAVAAAQGLADRAERQLAQIGPLPATERRVRPRDAAKGAA